MANRSLGMDANDTETASLLPASKEKGQYDSYGNSGLVTTSIDVSVETSALDQPWMLKLSDFVAKKKGSEVKRHKSRRVRKYYRAQDEMIEAYEDANAHIAACRAVDPDTFPDNDQQTKTALRFSQVTFGLNLLLMAAKLVASILSGSFSIISSLIESLVDLMSGVIMWWATRAIRKRDIQRYPQGRTKLEPLSVVILSVVMSLASVEFIRESVTKIMTLSSDSDPYPDLPDMTVLPFVMAGSTVVVKSFMWLVFRKINSNIVRALALDARNDVVSNTVAIVCGYLGSRQFQDSYDLYGFIYVDPGGAILISIYIIINWVIMGVEQIKLLTGHTADPVFLSKVTWVAMNHDENIRHIDTVRAFHFGNCFLVDVDIVLPKDMSVEKAHDIGESLQQKLERLEEVERAYVHIDYDTTHHPQSEHKVV